MINQTMINEQRSRALTNVNIERVQVLTLWISETSKEVSWHNIGNDLSHSWRC